MSRRAALVLYYCVARYLPDWSFPGGEAFRRIRGFLARRFLMETGDWINIESGVFLADGQHCRLGHGSSFGPGCRVYGATVGSDVMIGAGVTFLKDNHLFGESGRVAPDTSAPDPPTIGDGAWIGDQAIILPGVRIGQGAIVGAGAVVTKSVPAGGVAVGNPARVVRVRSGFVDAA